MSQYLCSAVDGTDGNSLIFCMEMPEAIIGAGDVQRNETKTFDTQPLEKLIVSASREKIGRNNSCGIDGGEGFTDSIHEGRLRITGDCIGFFPVDGEGVIVLSQLVSQQFLYGVKEFCLVAGKHTAIDGGTGVGGDDVYRVAGVKLGGGCRVAETGADYWPQETPLVGRGVKLIVLVALACYFRDGI